MRLREFVIGWLRTISALDERTFPIGIKNVNLKELGVIFPLSILAIVFFFRNLMISLASIIPVIYIVLYEEKSMDEFQYVYYFLKFYMRELLKSEKKERKEQTKLKLTFVSELKTFVLKYIDYEVFSLGALMIIFSLPNLIAFLELKTVNYKLGIENATLFSVGTGLILGELLYLWKRKKKQSKT